MTKQMESARRELVDDIIEQYRVSVIGVRSRFLSGITLPPAKFVNDELGRKGASWRVANVAAGRCEFVEL